MERYVATFNFLGVFFIDNVALSFHSLINYIIMRFITLTSILTEYLIINWK